MDDGQFQDETTTPSVPWLSPLTDCRHFSGYKPCGKNDDCSSACPHASRVRSRVLLIHLGALGAVVRSTALLPAIRRRFPDSHITWITDKPADAMLRGHPLIDRLLVSDADGLLQLSALSFDVALVVDKSLKASGILRQTKADVVFGFVADAATGSIVPATEAAREAWQLGLSDSLKFFGNEKTETQLVHEALELGPWTRDCYSLAQTEDELVESDNRRRKWSENGHRRIVGINTGCAATIPYKKLSIAGHVDLINKICDQRFKAVHGQPREVAIVLLGGREDRERNHEIALLSRARGIDVIESETEKGLRDGLISVAACEVIVSGDSLGMHMAIALQKPVIAWFGPTCAHEIDLYDRGESFVAHAPCAPCWKRSCQKPTMCYEMVDLEAMATATHRWLGPTTTKIRSPKVNQV